MKSSLFKFMERKVFVSLRDTITPIFSFNSYPLSLMSATNVLTNRWKCYYLLFVDFHSSLPLKALYFYI